MSCASVVGSFSPVAGIIISLSEVFFLIFVIIAKGLKSYLVSLLAILCTCLDTPLFVFGESERVLYSFTNLPIIHGYHLLIFSFIPLLWVLLNFKVFRLKLKQNNALKKTLAFTTLIYVVSILMFVLSLAINENEVWKYSDYYLTLFRKQFFIYSTIFFLIIDFTYVLLFDEKSIAEIKRVIFNILAGVGCASIISVVVGWRSGFEDCLLLTLCAFFSVFIILFSYYNMSNTLVCYLIGTLSSIAIIIAPTALGGKWWLVVFLVIMIVAIKIVSFHKYRVAARVLGIIGAITGVVIVISGKLEQIIGHHASYKLSQAIDLVLNIGKKDYIIQSSPGFRIEEFVNIALEYFHKPLLFLFGKGFGGTVEKQYWGINNWNLNGSTFSDIEIKMGHYANMHETVNVLFLIAGLIGLLFIFYETCFFIKNYKKNVYCVIGFVWFIFFFMSSYFSLVIGVASFTVAKIETDNNRKGVV